MKPDKKISKDKSHVEQVLSKSGVAGSGDKGPIYQIMKGDKVVATAKTEAGAMVIMRTFPGSYIWPTGN